MDQLEQLLSGIRKHLFMVLFIENSPLIGLWWAATTYTELSLQVIVAAGVIASMILTIAITYLSSNYLIKPMQTVWQTVLHLNPNHHSVPAPKHKRLLLG